MYSQAYAKPATTAASHSVCASTNRKVDSTMAFSPTCAGATDSNTGCWIQRIRNERQNSSSITGTSSAAPMRRGTTRAQSSQHRTDHDELQCVEPARVQADPGAVGRREGAQTQEGHEGDEGCGADEGGAAKQGRHRRCA